ncbi:hypothetical protein ACQP1K_10310 [Sphaerimonospora sp. CA-214678]|uniref:hypothetical protein n=1 Tax=Sphaerimonospora sp. CA-214678 TaxID=3240029 RepID=UPI003D936042
MFKRFHAVVAAAALGGSLLVAPTAATATTAALPAAAAAVRPPAPNTLAVSPGPVVVSDRRGTTATFTFKTADTGSARLVDPRGKIIPLSLTERRGTYTGKHTFKLTDRFGTWKFQATATKHRKRTTTSTSFEVHQASSLDLRASPATVGRGGKVTLQGTLKHREASGRHIGWKTHARQKVFIAFKPLSGGPYTRVGSVKTDRHGEFRLQQRASRSGWWRAEFEGTTTTSAATSDGKRVNVRAVSRDSRITGFTASPNPVARGGDLRLGGTLQVADRRHWDGYRGRTVKIMFKADGEHRWQQVATDRTDGSGRFSTKVTAASSGSWRAEYAGDSGVRSATSATIRVTVRVPQPAAATRVIKFGVSPKSVKRGHHVNLRGTLQRWAHGWKGYGHQKVTVQFKKAGSRHWSSVTTTRTNGSGAFHAKTRVTQSGAWRVVFTGGHGAKRSNSSTAYVTVRR